MTKAKTTILDIKTLFEIPQDEKILVGKIIEMNDQRYMDIRSHYVDERGNLHPTSRGIRLTAENTDMLYNIGVFDDSLMREIDKHIHTTFSEGGDLAP